MSEEREMGFMALGMTLALIGVGLVGIGPMIMATVVLAVFALSGRSKK